MRNELNRKRVACLKIQKKIVLNRFGIFMKKHRISQHQYLENLFRPVCIRVVCCVHKKYLFIYLMCKQIYAITSFQLLFFCRFALNLDWHVWHGE